MPHFIYCGEHYGQILYGGHQNPAKLKDRILTKMRKFGIQSSIVSHLHMRRLRLLTKEKAKKGQNGEMRNDEGRVYNAGSINDDLERFLSNLQNQKEVKDEIVESFFTPKLTDEEMKLVQEGNKKHLSSYVDSFNSKNPDVGFEEMERSNSNSKYVHGYCWRRTFPLILETNQFENEVETEDGTENATEDGTEDGTENDGQNKTEDICFEAPQIHVSST